MPKEMDCGVIPANIGAQGAGYNPSGSGISEPSAAAMMKTQSQETATSTDEETDSDGEELTASMGALQVA